MRRVAYVFPWGELGGAEIATLRLLEAHDRDRYTPVVYLLADGPLGNRLRSSSIEMRLAPKRPRLSKAAERREARRWIKTHLRKDGISLQHNVMSWTHALAGPAARAAGVRVVWYQHNRPDWRSFIDLWAAWNDTDLVLANSLFTAGLQRRLNFRRKPIEVLYPPMQLPDISSSREDVRAELGISEEEVLALLPARLQRWKGQDVAIRALAKTSAQAPNLRLAVAGGTLFDLEPDYPVELEKLARDLGVASRVQFLDQRDDIGSLYNACDIMLHTSRHPEPFGLVVAEAKTYGRAIVASNAGAIPEQITNEKTGLLVPPEDPSALGKAMARLAENPALRQQFGDAAAATPGGTPRQTAEQLESIYDRVLED